MILLNRNQIKQLRQIVKDNKDVGEVYLVEEGNSGIGRNIYADYVKSSGEKIRVDLTDYASW